MGIEGSSEALEQEETYHTLPELLPHTTIPLRLTTKSFETLEFKNSAQTKH